MHVLTNLQVTPKTGKKERKKEKKKKNQSFYLWSGDVLNAFKGLHRHLCQDMAQVDVTVKIKILQCSTLYH